MIGDIIIGIIQAKHSEAFSVDIGSANTANLSMLAFEGSSKRNRPSLLPGHVILGTITTAYKEMEPEISCVYSNGQAGGLGLISNGFLVQNLSSVTCRYLASKKCNLLNILEKSAKKSFSITSASNNRIVIEGEDPQDIILISSVVKFINLLFSKKKCLIQLGNDPSDPDWLSTVEYIDALYNGGRRPYFT